LRYSTNSLELSPININKSITLLSQVPPFDLSVNKGLGDTTYGYKGWLISMSASCKNDVS
jgi:hypothetical protein